jgi:hypothetical protein
VLELTTLDTAELSIRGRDMRLHLVEIPGEVRAVRPEDTLIGETVLLDGHRVRITGMERTTEAWNPGCSIPKKVGIEVVPIGDQSDA